MTNHLLHGTFVSGEPDIDKLAPFLPGRTRSHRYGFSSPPLMKLVNWRVVREIGDKIAEGDVLIGHSNGCLICHKIAERMIQKGRTPKAVICIAPAMRRDTRWPPGDYRVLCIHNPMDWVVEASRMWGRLFHHYTSIQHGWGSAGRNGFTNPDPRATNFKIGREGMKQHSLTDDFIERIGPIIGDWLARV